jgi:hypothetical protein
VAATAARPGEYRQTKRDLEYCLDWLRRFLSDTSHAQRASIRVYKNWRLQHLGAPTNQVLERHGGWSHVLGLARASMNPSSSP